MEIHFNSINCVVEWMHKNRSDQFDKIIHNDHRLKSNSAPSTKTYFLGVGAGVACAAITLAGRVGAVVETLFKGLGNIFGAPFSKQCNAWTGVKQLTGGLPLSILKFLFVMPLEILRDLVATPVCVAIDEKYAESQSDFESAFVKREKVQKFINLLDDESSFEGLNPLDDEF